jgi:hypothetical protein
MAALKRFSIALVLLGLVFSAVPVAQAQFSFPVQPLGRIVCTYSAVPNQVRAEGLAERVGDARLDCTNDGIFNPNGGNNIQQYVSANVTLSLNTAVTNRLDVGDGSALTTDAVLIVNDNNHYQPQATSTFPLDGPGCSTINVPDGTIPDQRYPCPMKGEYLASRSLVWDNVQFPVPGAPNNTGTLPSNTTVNGVPLCDDIFNQTSNNSCFDITTTLRLTNIRGNAAAVGEGGAILGTLTIFSFAGISVTPTNQQTLANVFEGLITDYDTPVTGLQCEIFEGSFDITLNEGFAGSFKTLGVPTFVQGDFAAENGYFVCESGNNLGAGYCGNPQSNAGTGGGATQATRFLIRLLGVQDGVEVSVYNSLNESGDNGGSCSVSPGGGPLCLELVTGADSNGKGGTTNGDSGTSDVDLDSDGNGYIVYELKEGDPFLRQDIDVPIIVYWEPDTANDEPAIGSSSLLVTFAPLSDVGSASKTAPSPRFIDDAGDPATFVTVVRCSTTLLFPFVSNRFGFDTGLAISNTSMDWKGTAPQRGRCMIHYIGNTGDDGPMPDDDLSEIIEGGEQVTWTLSMGNGVWGLNGAPDFQGFVVAMCEFQFAHGYAFITDATSAIPNFAQGYLALVMQFGVDSDGDVVRLIDCGYYKEHGCTSEGLNQ